jgi:phospholipid-transporting ATPase
MGVLEMVPQISTSNGQPVIYLPLFAIVIFTALKDLYEDYKRHRSDRNENEKIVKKCTIDLSPQSKNNVSPLNRDTLPCDDVMTQELRVGDIVCVSQNEGIPADLLLLHSSHA